MTENKQTTDSELLLQIVGYNSEAFEQLYNRYSATIYSLIKEIVTNPKLAEKMLLNVFSVFLKRIDYYSTTSNDIFTWLTLLARNISIDALKRMKFVEDIPIYSDDYEIECILPNLSKTITPINLDERAVLGEKIKLYKSHLTEIQNLVISLVYFEGLNEEEIAKRLSVPVVTLRQKIVNIMENLHHQYTGQTEDANSNKEVLSLIKLEALGCLSAEEITLLDEMRNSDPDFLWKELGEYQNLTALLATPIPLQYPGHELNTELNDIFKKILQGNEVDYPIIAPEPPVIKQFEEPVPELEQQQIQNLVTEVIKLPEIQERKKTDFELKFRERDPKELNILKIIEPDELKQKQVLVDARKESEIQFRNNYAPHKKPVGVADRKNSPLDIKEPIKAVITNDNSIQNKTATLTSNKPDTQIENDDTSIIIEEPKQLLVKEEVQVKNRLIPNSSINLKEFFKKEDSPIVRREFVTAKISEENKVAENPIVQKPDIIIKSNVLPNDIKRNPVFVNKNENVIQSKPVTPVVQKLSIENKKVEPAKDIQKSDIVIKTNLPPNDIKKSSVFVNKNETTSQNKPAAQIEQKPLVENKNTGPVKEIQKTAPVVAKEEAKVENGQAATIIEKSDIVIKTNEPPKDTRRNSVFVDKNENIIPGIPAAPVVPKPSIENKINTPVKESQNPASFVKEEKPIAAKSQQPVTKPEIKASAQSPNQKEKINTEFKKTENLFERINPPVDRSSLKIRETVFVENEKKCEILKQEPDSVITGSDLKPDNFVPTSNLTNPINIDEIISKIEEKPAPVDKIESDSYENEIIIPKNKFRRNVLVSAAVFVIIASVSVFVYLEFQKTPEKIVKKVNNSEKINLGEQTNLAINQESTPEIAIQTPEETTTSVIPEEVTVDKKIVVPPLPEVTTKEESTLSVLSVNNNNLIGNDDKQPTQTAAAKTETILPPKEIKKVSEEPEFFMAVEEMPELIGGIKGLQKRIVYPEIAKRVGVEGKVLVQALIDETGKVISVNTIKGIGSGCDEVALDAVRNSQFTPGKQRGKNVKTQVTIPIVFKK